MRDLLSDEARPAIDRVARERMLLAFDFDGTLAPLVEDRAGCSAWRRCSTRARSSRGEHARTSSIATSGIDATRSKRSERARPEMTAHG